MSTLYGGTCGHATVRLFYWDQQEKRLSWFGVLYCITNKHIAYFPTWKLSWCGGFEPLFFYSALFIIQFYFILFCVSLTQTQQWEQKKHWLCKHLSADNVNNKHKKWSTSIKKKYTARLNLVVMLDALHQMIIIMSLFVCITSCTFYIFFFMTQNCLTQSWRVDRLSGCLWPQVEWELVSGNPVSGIWSSDGPFLSFSVYF